MNSTSTLQSKKEAYIEEIMINKRLVVLLTL